MTNLILKSNKDLYDAYSLAHESIDWLVVLLRQIEKEIEYTRNEVDRKEGNNSCFHDLDKLIAIASFTANEQLEHFDSIKARLKKAVIL